MPKWRNHKFALCGPGRPAEGIALGRPGKTTLLPGRYAIKAMDGFDRKLKLGVTVDDVVGEVFQKIAGAFALFQG